MNSVLESVRAAGRLDCVDEAVRLFEGERLRGEEPLLERHWEASARAADGDVAVLAALVKSDLRHRFGRGEFPAVADYIERFPELRASDSRILSLIYEEFCLREEGDESLGVESFCDRYPDWKDSLTSQLQYHRLIGQAAAGLGVVAPKFPKSGEFFGEFELLSMLGTGGSSRVFLARDTSLGDRVVVLKVAIDRGNEPMILGGLKHPHIVWVHSVSYQPETRLRGLSMPHHPGLPLDEIIRRLDKSALPRHARVLWDALFAGSESDVPALPATTGAKVVPLNAAISLTRGAPVGDGWEGFPVRGSYARGVAWVGRVLAEALHHAHGKGIFHRDIKPGNVLMTVSQGPQLLDFNLAESPHSAERADDALHGGTLPYMAPEQIQAFLDQSLWGKVGARADLYSLGLVLRELLTGRLPELPDEQLPKGRALSEFLDRRSCLDTSIRRFNPEVPHALEAIVARCLAFSPDDRYADAADLAEDLNRFLDFRPLAFAKNPRRRDRLENWLARHRRLAELAVACSFLAAVVLDPLSIERAPAFTQAIRNLSKPAIPHGTHLGERGKNVKKIVQANGRDGDDEAIAPLKRLADSYPQSPLPELLMSLALDASDRDDHKPAEEAFRRAMALPDAESEVVKWANAHPEVGLADWIDKFAQRCLEGGYLVKSYVTTDTPLPSGRDSSDREALLALARQATELTLKINPGRGKTLYVRANYEDSQEHFEAAHDLISSLLATSDAHKSLEVPGENFGLSLLLTRSRIATRWAEQLQLRALASVIPSASATFATRWVDQLRLLGGRDHKRDAVKLLEHALADLDRGDRLGVREASQVFNSLYFRTVASVTLAEVEVELDRPDEALRLIEQAEKAFAELSRKGSEIYQEQKIRDRLDRAKRRAKSSRPKPNALPLDAVQSPTPHPGLAARLQARPD